MARLRGFGSYGDVAVPPAPPSGPPPPPGGRPQPGGASSAVVPAPYIVAGAVMVLLVGALVFR